MADLAKYIRIYDRAPADDMVSKRETSIANAVTLLRKDNNVQSLVSLGSAAARTFADGIASDPLGTTVAGAIKKQSSAYVREEREQETAVLSAATMMQFLEGVDTANNVTVKDIVGGALWSALSFQQPIKDPKFEQLRQYLLAVATQRCMERAEIGRKRTKPVEIPEAADGDVTQLGKSLKAASGVILALQTNATLDREELDILWWAQGGRSPITGSSYDKLNAPAKGIIRGVELGLLLRRLPSRAHRSLALNDVGSTDPLDLASLLEQISEIQESVVAKLPSREFVEANSITFPLLNSIITGKVATDGQKRSVDEWTGRALLEAGLASLCTNPAPRL